MSGCFGYQRESGRFVVFQAKAVVLATGGIGRCWEITSNSWEYTADGHAMAMWAGADLIDMEFVQFHPTGMVWPPSVRGTLITEGVRGEGGVLLNGKRQAVHVRLHSGHVQGRVCGDGGGSDKWIASTIAGERPDGAAAAGAVDARRGGAGDSARRFAKAAGRRTAACIWISRRGGRPEDIKKKLPSMYHQFKELADVDITTEPMEVGPTCHYMMGGVRVNAETQESTVPGSVCGGRSRRRHARGESAGRQFAVGLVGVRQAGRRVRGEEGEGDVAGADQSGRSRARGGRSRCGRLGDGQGENPYAIHEELRAVMQSLVGIVRTEEDLDERRWRRSPSCARGRRRPRSAATFNSIRAGTWRSI